MKKYISVMMAITLLTTSLSGYASNYERPHTKVIDTLEIEASVMTVEDTYTVVITTPERREINSLILIHEISRKNYSTTVKDGIKSQVMRVGLYGLSPDSDVETIRNLIEGNTYNMRCQSVFMQDKVNTFPMCQILINGRDIFIEMSKHPTMKTSVVLSTRRIHPNLPLHSEYEKAIGNLLIRNF